MKKKGQASYPIADIGGIDPALALKLKSVRIRTTARLLEAAKNAKGRKSLSYRTGIPAADILKWANKADLMRIKGIGEEYTELLRAAGVDTLRELRLRKPEQLARKMAEANIRKKLVRLLPSEKSIEKWIDRAKETALQITY